MSYRAMRRNLPNQIQAVNDLKGVLGYGLRLGIRHSSPASEREAALLLNTFEHTIDLALPVVRNRGLH